MPQTHHQLSPATISREASKAREPPARIWQLHEVTFLLDVWIYTLLFPALFQSRVILAAIGPMGSGKTTTIKLVGRTMFGRSFDPTPLPHKPDDLDASLTNETFVLLDNADKRAEWLEDKLAVAATGGSIDRHALLRRMS